MNPNMDITKPMRARKTMTPSSQKRVATLSKKNIQGAEKMANGGSSADNHVHFKRAETSSLYVNSLKDLNLKPESKQTLLPSPTLKEPITNVVVNSEISIYNGSQEESHGLAYSACPTNSDVKQFLNAGALQDILYCYFEKESSSSLFKPVEVHLNSEPAVQPSGPLEKQFSVTSPRSEIPVLHKVAKIKDKMLVKRTVPVLESENDNSQLPKKNVSASVLPDATQKKRRSSETDGDVLSKHTKICDEARERCSTASDIKPSGLGKVKCFIQSQLDNSMQTLDHSLQHLSERIDRTQCLRKHEGIAIKIVKKISRLDRRINAVISFQKTELSKKGSLPRAHSQNKTLNGTTSLPGNTNGMSAPLKEMPSSPKETLSKIAESSDDVICLAEVNKNADVEAVDSADVQQKEASVNAGTTAATLHNSKDLLLIDLTDEGSDGHKGVGKEEEKGIARRRNSGLESLASSPPQPVLQSTNQVSKLFPHLPPLPSIALQLEHPDKFRHTLPPQKLELAVTQVQNPKGFALHWNISKVDPRCAPIESFCLFICLEYANKGALSNWMETGTIKFMSLPMACSVSQVPGCSKCYFAIQSKDIYGRYGPFCEIQSVSVL
ncbi:activating transcription factor 7-interacting protein 2 isoform X2 [Rhineura floridana]|nr:activating transcription factor 7-interacting protein 2 isoform X2 [Rhineura floridana]XP_061455232.1 activating transcription factor 7-interacting protein 2 isoform X2 [Rhineura floridana]